MIASSVVIRCFQVSRGATSPWRMVPKAPLMWPTCASSSTAVATLGSIFTFTVMVSLLGRSRPEETLDDQSIRVRDGAGAAVSCLDFKTREPTKDGKTCPVGRLGPSFKTVSCAFAAHRGEAWRPRAVSRRRRSQRIAHPLDGYMSVSGGYARTRNFIIAARPKPVDEFLRARINALCQLLKVARSSPRTLLL